MAKVKAKKKGLSSRVAINQIKVDSLPYSTFAGNNEIVPFGLDNLYPNRINRAIRKSPTALGCVKRQSEFIFGQGLALHGGTVVNREGETLNDILSQCIRHGYANLYGYALHFNFNALGQIVEMFSVNLEHLRKTTDLNRVEFGLWDEIQNGFQRDNFHTIDLYKIGTAYDRMVEFGYENYKGQIHYFSKDSEIYPTSPIDSASISANYELESQIYTYANISNGFSANTLVKLPTTKVGTSADEEAKKMEENLLRLHGARNAGGSIVMPVSVGASGEPKPFTAVENLSPTNVDTLFLNQNKKAESDILKVYNMPRELLAIEQSNGFSDTAYEGAWNMKNDDLEGDRQAIERDFNKFLPNTIWNISDIKLVPLKRKEKIEQKNDFR